MRIAKVIGKVVLNVRLADVPPGNYLIIRPQSREALSGGDNANDETLVTYDELAAREGDLIGLVEGREAAVPFTPARVPFDCYNACILDTVDFEPVL